jgi:hypothetical protein
MVACGLSGSTASVSWRRPSDVSHSHKLLAPLLTALRVVLPRASCLLTN